MKRKGNILQEAASDLNVILAWREALRNKHHSVSAKKRFRDFEADLVTNLQDVQNIILTGDWNVCEYRNKKCVQCGKVRNIDYNPSVRDSVIQHALAQTAGQYLINSCITDTYSGFVGRGTKLGRIRMLKFISEYGKDQPIYCLKFDVHHFYESVNNEKLKLLLRRKLKDKTILKLFDALIDSHPNGLPIGNFLSQLLANYYLSPLDHFVKDKCGFRHYARYCDDIVVISDSKQKLRGLFSQIVDLLKEYDLSVKANWQIFPIERYGIDYMGYVFRRNDLQLRKRIERSIRRKAHECENPNAGKRKIQGLLSYWGWAKHLKRGKTFWNYAVGMSLRELKQRMKHDNVGRIATHECA